MRDWLLDRRKAALWCGMGLGKTASTLTALSERILGGANKGALVICPHRCGPTAWEAQIKRWEHLTWMKAYNLRTEEGQAAWVRGHGELFWINSERLPSIARTRDGKTKRYPGFVEHFIKGKTKKLPVDCVIIDEVSLAKNPSSRRFNSLRSFLHDMPSRNYRTFVKNQWQLTGTPHAGSYQNIFAQIRLLDPTIFGTAFHPWRERYFESDYMGYKWELRKGAKEEIDAKLAEVALVMRSEDYLDLPPCTIEDIDVTLPAGAAKAYRTLEKDLLLELKEGDVTALTAAALSTKLLQATGGCLYTEDGATAVLHNAKIKALIKLLKSFKGEPTIVVAQYIHERKRLLEEIGGAVEFHERRIDDWMQGKIKVMIAQVDQMSHGIDGLQEGGRRIVWFSPIWSMEGYSQLIKRLHRPGQKEETFVYRLLAKDTIDWAVAAVLQEKEDGESGLFEALKILQGMRK
jgi:SNF2 family DNA or RNA helicase